MASAGKTDSIAKKSTDDEQKDFKGSGVEGKKQAVQAGEPSVVTCEDVLKSQKRR